MSHTIEIESMAGLEPVTETHCNLLVATDGTHDSDGAIRVGVALGQRDGSSSEILTVVEPFLLADAEPSTVDDAARLTRIAIEQREGELRAQRQRTHPAMHDCPFTVRVGDRVQEIVAVANSRRASLILLGLGSHGVVARLLRRETALRVIRAAKTPVLAVPSDAWGVPHSALAAIDFGESSEAAAKTALDLLAGDGTLYLAHVAPRVPLPQADSRGDSLEMPGFVTGLDAVRRRLAVPKGVHVELVLLHGEPAHELLAFAEQRQIDMIATGAHGRSAFGRLVLGSVSSKIVRSAHSWILVAPPIE